MDVAHDVAREAELDRLITKRHDKRVSEEGTGSRRSSTWTV